ncbi:MAG: sugar kinase [Acidobacteria bacterium]|nr:sugar kinase [Acidobacteriota bacterium]
MGVLVVGSVALDSVITPFGSKKDILGGSATYAGIAASYFTDVSMVAVVGEDFPEEHTEFLRIKGIDTAGLRRVPGRTFRWKGKYEDNLNARTTLDTQLNVFAGFNPELAPGQRRCPYLFLGNIDPDLQRSVLGQMTDAKFVACDTMNMWIQNKRDSLMKMLERIDLLVVNDEEAWMLAGTPNVLQAARKIMEMGPKRLVIKRGEYGAILFGPRTQFCVPAFLIENVFDPTGAGDSFAGGLIGYLASSASLDEISFRKAVVYGTVMASYTVAEFGAKRLGELTFTEIEARYREFCKITLFEDFNKNNAVKFDLTPF